MQVLFRQSGFSGRMFFSALKQHTLPELKYGYGDLEPVLSATLLEFHHKKHHQAYINNLNKAQEDLSDAIVKNDAFRVAQLQRTIQFNLGGHHNHSIFWENLTPVKNGGGQFPSDSSPLSQHIKRVWGSYDQFIAEFSTKTAAIQGSGWGWLGVDRQNKELRYLELPNQEIPEHHGITPVLTIDVWEHAYWFDYKNVRPDFLKNIWRVVNWKEAERRYIEATK